MADRVMVYPGALPLETDILSTNVNMMVAVAALAAMMVGSSTFVHGLAVAPTAPGTMSVQVSRGSIYALENLDNTAFSSLSSDTTHQIVKQGINLDPTVLACPAPVTVGQSINYLIQATLSETDADEALLLYYNASNPSQAYSGPANSGAEQPTVRQCRALLQAKAGAAATTGSQTTPAPDTGYVGIAVVTVPYGTTSIGSGNISVAPNAPILTSGGLVRATQSGSLIYAADTGTVNTLAVNLLPGPSAAVAGMSIFAKVANTNTGAATLNLNGLGSASITYAGQAVASGMLRSGQIYAFVYDGTNWQVLNPNLTGIYATADAIVAGTTTVTVPAWATHAEVQIVGAGGGGGYGGTTFSGGGGAAGANVFGRVSVTPGASLTCVVGAGGTGGTSGSTTGSTGGTSSLTGIASAAGGSGGQGSGTTSAGGAGGAATVIAAGLRGFSGGDGGDGNASNASVQGGNGAAGPFGGEGRTGNGAGAVGAAPGAGGGGAWGSAGGVGGAGAPGAVLITWMA